MEQQNENNAMPATETPAAAAIHPGTFLREARERLGLSVADAAAQTKLAPRQIEALEAGDYQHLPEMAFVRGFVRSYAKVLQIDAQPLLAALPQAHVVAQVSPASVEVPFPDARSPQLQNLIWLGAALFLSVVVVAVAVWNFTSPSTQEAPGESTQADGVAQVETTIALPAQMQVIPASAVEEVYASSAVPPVALAAQSSVPAVRAASVPVAVMPAIKPAAVAEKSLPVSAVAVAKPAAAKPLPVSAVPATKPLAPAVKPAATAAASAATTATLRLTFGEESWTEVRDRNGNIVSSQLNPPGSELRLSGQGPFSLVVGRASSARLTYKGKVVDLKSSTNATSDVARVTLE